MAMPDAAAAHDWLKTQGLDDAQRWLAEQDSSNQQRIFDDTVEEMRREKACKETAEDAAQRHGHIKGCQIGRRWASQI